MRVTQNALSRQYVKNLGNSQSRMMDYMNKILSGRKFNRASEKSIDASKAMTVRKQMQNLDNYDDTLNTAKELFNAAETNLTSIIDTYSLEAKTKVISATNGTNIDVIDCYVEDLEGLAENIMDNLNADFAERQIFGGTNNSATPFTYQQVTVTNAGGDVLYNSGSKKTICYNGVPVSMNASDIAAANGNGTYTVTYNGDASTAKNMTINFADARTSGNNEDMFPGSKPIYVDIGIGIKYDSNYEVDPQTALNISINGAKCSGSGTDSDGFSKNIIQLVFDAADACKRSDQTTLNKLIDKITDATNTVTETRTSLGSMQNSITFNISKNNEYRANLNEMQNDLETYDTVETGEMYTDYTVMQSAYQAVLKMGSSAIPTTLFDFL